MIIFQVTFRVPAHFADVFYSETMRCQTQAIAQPGVHAELLRDKDDPTYWLTLEAYPDRAALGMHLHTPHFLAWKEKTTLWQPKPAIGIRYHYPLQGDSHQALRSHSKALRSYSSPSSLHFQTLFNIRPAQLANFVTACQARYDSSQQHAERLLFLQQYNQPNRFILLESYPTAESATAQRQHASFAAWHTQVQACSDELVFQTRQLTAHHPPHRQTRSQ